MATMDGVRRKTHHSTSAGAERPVVKSARHPQREQISLESRKMFMGVSMIVSVVLVGGIWLFQTGANLNHYRAEPKEDSAVFENARSTVKQLQEQFATQQRTLENSVRAAQEALNANVGTETNNNANESANTNTEDLGVASGNSNEDGARVLGSQTESTPVLP